MTLLEVRKAGRDNLECKNCELYSWDQAPNLPSSLTRCSRCQTLHYCSKECQEEHWVKVHKGQCDQLRPPRQPFFACSKELVGQISFEHIDMSVHNHRYCSECKKDDEEGMVEKPDNSSYGCHVDFSMPDWEEGPRTIPWGSKDVKEDIRTCLPFDIYELKNLESGAEKILWLLQAVLYKMKKTKYPMARSQDRLALIELKNILQNARVKTWTVYTSTPKTSYKLEHKATTAVLAVLGNARYQDILSSVKVKPAKMDMFGLWDIFKLLSEFVLSTDVVASELYSLDKLQLEEFPAEYRQVVEAARNIKSLNIRNIIVSALDPELITFNRVLELLCGSLQQKCDACKEGITIAAVYYSEDDKKMPSLPFVTIGMVRKFCCVRKVCGEKVLEERRKEFRILHSLIRAMRAKFVGNICDFCFLVGREDSAHRCSGCLTKIYCSQQCLEADWSKVHKKVCARSKEQERKRKEGRRGRTNVGKHQMEGWIDCHSKAFGNKSVMDQVVQKMEKL